MAVLYHLGVMQQVVKGFAWVMQKTMRTSGAETLSASANIFVGQTEAPLLVRPFVGKMTESELMCVMTGGFATVAGGVMAAYVGMLHAAFPDIAGHLLAASVLSAPAALVCAKVMFPEDGEPETRDTLHVRVERIDANVIDAAARGASEGLRLAANVGAMLLAFIALISMLNWALAFMAGLVGIEAFTFERLMGWVAWPFAFAMGVPAAECAQVGQLLGEKLVLNEFVAYAHLQRMLEGGEALSYRALTLSTYALCGFANFASIGIQIGGIGSLAPERRHDLAKLGLRALFAGTLACQMTANIAGMLL
jgi:CNT family concentrative nucleoside transporter